MQERGFFGGEYDSSDRFKVELHDDDVLVLDLRHHLVHRIPGALVDDLVRGVPRPELSHLPAEALPFVRDSLAGTLVARRRFLISGGALAVGGIITSALPFAAAAASRYLTFTDGSVKTFVAHDGSGSTSDVNRVDLFGGSFLRLSDIVNGEIQVLMSGTQGGIGGTGTTGTPGLGTYAFLEIRNLPATNAVAGSLVLSLRQGGTRNLGSVTPVVGGDGGMGAFIYLQKFPGGEGESPELTMIAAAAGGGGASGTGNGGNAALGAGANGTSTTAGNGGAGASTTAGGAAGVMADGQGHLGGGPAAAGLTVDAEDQLVGVARSNPAWSYGGIATNRRAGGGGGAGYMFGGGGAAASISASAPYADNAGGGGGGASYTKTATTGAGDPYVHTQRIMTTARTVESGATLTVYYR